MIRGAWNSIEHSNIEKLENLKKVSTIESIGSSNRIEGNKLTDMDVEKLLLNISKQSFRTRDEEEIVGYSDVMNLILSNYESIPLSENYIKQLHQMLLKYVSKDERHRGEYKKVSNSVAAFDINGKEVGVVFQTATPYDTQKLMEELVRWTKKELEEAYIHPLIIIGIFVVHFLAIHPFQDGNGRLSRILTTLLLLKKDYGYIAYSSVESIIEDNKNEYYRSLRQTQKNIWTDDVDYEPWLSFFLVSLQKQKRHLEEKLKGIKQNDNELSRTARSILSVFNDKKEWSSDEISNKLELNLETVKKTLRNLVAKGYIVKHGATKGAWYEKL